MARRIGYSYGRYSSGVQGKGHSEERQDAGAIGWCKRHDVELDTSHVYMDRGTSAFRGKHRQAGSPLRSFLDEVEAGRIPAGSVLIIENLDRLSREHPWEAVPLLCGIVNAGLDVVTLSPSEVTYTRSGDLTGLILAVVEFGRGHSESKSKSDRLSAVWGKRKQAARDGRVIITRRLPSWIMEKGGKLVLIPDRAVIVRRIFALAIAGSGLYEIVRMLTWEEVKPWGRGSGWSKAFVRKILTRRVAIGEHQPMHAGKPDGEPIKDYYPAVVTEKTFLRAQTAITSRRERPGRIGAKVTNLFSGLLTDAGSGERMLIAWQTQGSGTKRRRARMLVPAPAMEGRVPSATFPYELFEAAILGVLKEVTPDDLAGTGPSPTTALAVELAAVEQRMKELEEEVIAGGSVPVLVKLLRQLDVSREEIAARLTAARDSEANPARGLLAEAKTLISCAADPEKRLRLRSILERLVESIFVLVVPGHSRRICAVQINFKDGSRRDYLIDYRPARRGVKGTAEQLVIKGSVEKKDLRVRPAAREFRRMLEKLMAG